MGYTVGITGKIGGTLVLALQWERLRNSAALLT